jgi:serine protease Do
MKNRFSWIVRGSIAGLIVGYATFGDPLLDVWESVLSLNHSAELTSPIDLDSYSATDDEEVDTTNSRSSWKSRLVQQAGSGRFGSESQNNSSRAHQRNNQTTLRAFRESIGDKWKSTVQVLDKNRQVALGAIVSPDGWIVTKSSEVPNQTIEVRLYDNSKAEGTVKSRRSDLDLALIKIERSNLQSIQWNTTVALRVGGWLATTDFRSSPVSIGVLSVASRSVRRERPVLGVTLGFTPNGQDGAIVEKVVGGSGADRAGLQTGDLITTIDGELLKSQPEVLARLKSLTAGQQVFLSILRDGKKVPVTARMMDLSDTLIDPTEMEVNGDISSRSTGFQKIMQHDSVLAPHQCGGPLVDVYGNVVGLNIARAGRVSSYAIPASIASAAIADMMASVTGVQSPFEDNVAQAPSNSPNVRTTIELPTSVPNAIVIESLKPEVILPSQGSRP